MNEAKRAESGRRKSGNDEIAAIQSLPEVLISGC